MSRQIKIKVRPNETVRFPGSCVNCSRPAGKSMELRQRDGRTVRQIEVPLCSRCAGDLKRESGEEERLRKLSRLAMIVTGVLFALLLFFLFPAALGLRLILALIGGVSAAALVWWLFQDIIKKAALPEKKAIWESARIDAFSWRTATFVFSNESFVERFVELNEPLLVEN
jgi:hypothetical protein